jgi:hypothetical protein
MAETAVAAEASGSRVAASHSATAAAATDMSVAQATAQARALDLAGAQAKLADANAAVVTGMQDGSLAGDDLSNALARQSSAQRSPTPRRPTRELRMPLVLPRSPPQSR